MKLKHAHATIEVNFDQYVPFPSKDEVFAMYARSPNPQRIWDILRARAEGHTLTEIGKRFTMSAERVRQIEARFLARIRQRARQNASVLDWRESSQGEHENR